ncbi:hypothetical protein MRX96_032123 [Rhipicephalus microplus]
MCGCQSRSLPARIALQWVPRSRLPTAFIEIDAAHRWRDCVPHVDIGLVNASDVAPSSRATDASGSTRTPLAWKGTTTSDAASRVHDYSTI